MGSAKRLDEFGYETTEDGLGLQPQGIAPGGVDPNASSIPNPFSPPAPTGGFNLEAIRKQLGFGKTNLSDPQAWLKANQGIAQGVTIRGDKMYDPSGRYMADVISNMKQGGTASQFLDGIDSKTGKKRAPKPVKLKTPAPVAKMTQPAPQVAIQPQPETMPVDPALNPITVTGQANKGPTMDDIGNELKKLFPNGLYNQDLVTNRVSSVSDQLERGRKSRLATNRAALAERGLLGSGPEATAMNRMDEDLYDTFAGSVRDIHGDESAKADQRMMQALSTAAGLTSEQARLVIDKYKAENENKFNEGQLKLGQGRLQLDDKLGSGRLDLDTLLGKGNLALGNRRLSIDEMLGKGQLALGNLNAQNSYNLGLGNLSLGQSELALRAQQGDTGAAIQLLQLYLDGAKSTQGGYR